MIHAQHKTSTSLCQIINKTFFCWDRRSGVKMTIPSSHSCHSPFTRIDAAGLFARYITHVGDQQGVLDDELMIHSKVVSEGHAGQEFGLFNSQSHCVYHPSARFFRSSCVVITLIGWPVRNDSLIRNVARVVAASSANAIGAGNPARTTLQIARTSSACPLS